MTTHRHAVLLVDDDSDVLDALGTALTMNDVAVHTATSGLEAVQAVANGLRPCVVLLDIRMPNIDGWDAWEQMRRLPGMADVPAVMFSGDPPDYTRGAQPLPFEERPKMGVSIADRICGACQAMAPVEVKDRQDEIARRLQLVGARVMRGKGQA